MSFPGITHLYWRSVAFAFWCLRLNSNTDLPWNLSFPKGTKKPRSCTKSTISRTISTAKTSCAIGSFHGNILQMAEFQQLSGLTCSLFCIGRTEFLRRKWSYIWIKVMFWTAQKWKIWTTVFLPIMNSKVWGFQGSVNFLWQVIYSRTIFLPSSLWTNYNYLLFINYSRARYMSLPIQFWCTNYFAHHFLQVFCRNLRFPISVAVIPLRGKVLSLMPLD